MIETKECAKCHQVKLLTDFSIQKSAGDGRQRYCKDCHKTVVVTWQQVNPDKKRATDISWASDNLEKKRKSRRESAARIKQDPPRHLIKAVRCRICAALKRGAKKEGHTTELLGCSWDQFMGWLEIQFEEGMAWDNYGEWHVDHIKPLASFDKTQPDWQKKAFHYKNTQPLWAEANLKKGAKI